MVRARCETLDIDSAVQGMGLPGKVRKHSPDAGRDEVTTPEDQVDMMKMPPHEIRIALGQRMIVHMQRDLDTRVLGANGFSELGHREDVNDIASLLSNIASHTSRVGGVIE